MAFDLDCVEGESNTPYPLFGTNTVPSFLQPLSPQLQPDHQAQRGSLLASLRGQTISIPNLKPLFRNWPAKINPEVYRMRSDVQEWLDSTIPKGRRLDTLQASDFGLFGSTWWPCANFDRLQIVTYLAVWLFTWDDEIDLSDGIMWDQFGAAQVYRDETLAYVRYSLGIDELCPRVHNRIILNFAPIGTALKNTYSLEQRELVYEQMRFFMNMSEHEQHLRLAGKIPSIEEFWHYRLGSSAVTLARYDDKDVKSIIRYTNTIISATNDLLSIKKAIKQDAIDSLIPIIYFHVGDIQRTVAEVVTFIAAEIKHLDDAAASLFQRYELADHDMRRQVKEFVDGCKHYATGNLTWSLETNRYGVDYVAGEIVMTL